MAPVSENRGQLIIVAGIGLAVTLVALALVLNSAIYTENLASRNIETGAGDAVALNQEVDHSLDRYLPVAVRANPGDIADQESAVIDVVDDLDTQFNRYRAKNGEAVSIGYLSRTEGTFIAQTDDDRQFTDREDTADWELVDGAADIRSYRLEVERSSLADETVITLGTDPTFRIELEDANGDTWVVRVYRNTGTDEIVVETITPGGSATECRVSVPSAVIDVSQGRVGGEPCPSLGAVLEDSVGPYELEYENGDLGKGTYSLIVPNSVGTFSTGAGNTYYASAGSTNSPYVVEAIYAANIEVRYRNNQVTHTATVTVVGGERE